MKDLLCDEFQHAVDECLIRHRSVIDVTTKLQDATSRVNRAFAKAVTSCGCVGITASKQWRPTDAGLDELAPHMETHVDGSLCDDCRETIEMEIGNLLFYLAALCNVLDVNLYDAILKEHKKLSTLGRFNFS